jgi:hypothetical protein
MSGMSERERSIRQRLKDDFQHYGVKCLKIRPKDPRAGNKPLLLNRAQAYLHERLEDQRKATGKVRALVLKGRQQGISTYIGGRFYWRTTHGRGIRTFILTHEQDATDNLFTMVDRYHDNCPPLVRPESAARGSWGRWCARTRTGWAWPDLITTERRYAIDRLKRKRQPER